MNEQFESWSIFRGQNAPHDGIDKLPAAPPWREGKGTAIERKIGPGLQESVFVAGDEVRRAVNAALYLRRPLLVTGKPGTGKSSLARAVAWELKLGELLKWAITSRTTLQDGLYSYDAVGRLQEAATRRGGSDAGTAPPEITEFMRLGPLGTALLPSKRPRVILIDEIDKADIDLPNDLLNVFEEGSFSIPELVRIAKSKQLPTIRPADGEDAIPLADGVVRCAAYPFVILTSNGEREVPPAFLRRCIRLNMEQPDETRLRQIVQAHLGADSLQHAPTVLQQFVDSRKTAELATDQLMNAVYLSMQGASLDPPLLEVILRSLTSG